jgi:hypothetical protein
VGVPHDSDVTEISAFVVFHNNSSDRRFTVPRTSTLRDLPEQDIPASAEVAPAG